MIAQLLLLPTLAALAAAESFVTNTDDINPPISATRVFSNPVETPSHLVDDGSTSAHSGIVVTITGAEGEAFTTTFRPLTPTISSYMNSESGTNTDIIIITGTRSNIEVSETAEASGTTLTPSTAQAPATAKASETTVSRVSDSSSNPAPAPTAMMSHAFARVVAIVGLLILV